MLASLILSLVSAIVATAAPNPQPESAANVVNLQVPPKGTKLSYFPWIGLEDVTGVDPWEAFGDQFACTKVVDSRRS